MWLPTCAIAQGDGKDNDALKVGVIIQSSNDIYTLILLLILQLFAHLRARMEEDVCIQTNHVSVNLGGPDIAASRVLILLTASTWP